MLQKKIFANNAIILRLILTALFSTAFLLTFFLCGGANFLLGRYGDAKNYSSLDFEVHFIDVGQGDSAFVRFPDDTNLLIDAGPLKSSNSLVAYLKDLFKEEGITKIDNFLMTHQDLDHIGGAAAVFQNFQVDCVYRPTFYASFEPEYDPEIQSQPTAYYDNAIRSALDEPNCQICYSSSQTAWEGLDYSVEFLSPAAKHYSSTNNYSPIVKITYNGKNFLFTGDAESVAENEVIRNCPDKLKADVLKVGHHGSEYSTSAKFLSYVMPKIAIISVGNNGYGHPSASTIERLQAVGSEIYQTRALGTIVIGVDRSGEILIGGQEGRHIDFALMIVIYLTAMLLVWGIKTKAKPIRQN